MLVEKKYYEKIDGLRFVAIFLVLVEHFATVIGRHISAGFYGVDLFFVISGFLITSILLKQNEKSFGANYRNFIGRRTLRIFQIYYLTVLILWLVNMDVVRQRIFWLVTYSFNYAAIKFHLPAGPVTHFWSLYVEEQFYLFWPLIVISLKKKQNILTGLIIAIILFGYIQMLFSVIPSISSYNNYGLLTRMSSLGLGSFGAVFAMKNSLPENLLKSKIFEFTVFTVLVISLTVTFKMNALFLGLCSLYLVTKSSMYDFHLKPVNSFLKNKTVIHIGTLAYGIYVYHMPISYYFTLYIFDPVWNHIDFSSLGLLRKIQWHSWILKFPLYSLLSFGVASLSYKYIEKPLLNLKDKFFSY